ncbi:hypothetical protein NDU88_006935 [Pleurodeles waltl]|uniref:Uncharacterized protein n=1 Tax=Pleurodeles waltl TaxID=8319 RepID=A0AAV7QJ65_PLEWA|nr:hypothetical protein NDU88_006935 [Pleurodeles waltl]
MVRTAADVTTADVTAIFYLFNHSIPDLRQERTYTASAPVTSVWKRQWLVRQRPPEEGYLACHRKGRPDPAGPPQTEHPLAQKIGGHLPQEQEDGGGSAGPGLPTWEGCPSRTSTSAKTILGPVVPVVTGMWSAPATRTASVSRSHSTASPPLKHQKLDSARRERGKTPASKAAHKGPEGSVDSAVTPPRVGKGQKKSPKSGRSSTAEKTAIIPAAQEATASPIVTGQEATARVTGQEASPMVTGQETTTRVTVQEASPIITGQEATARVTAQEASPIVTGQEATASHSPTGQEGPASHSPADP